MFCIQTKQNKTRGVSHRHGLAIYIKKYLEAKEEFMKTQIYFTMQKNIIFEKSLKKKPKSFKKV
jgi:hypothetical protein